MLLLHGQVNIFHAFVFSITPIDSVRFKIEKGEYAGALTTVATSQLKILGVATSTVKRNTASYFFRTYHTYELTNYKLKNLLHLTILKYYIHMKVRMSL